MRERRHARCRARRARCRRGCALGSSVRGLSEVSTTTSLARAAASPMSGRLPRSRSPPQPKTVMSAPGRERAEGGEQTLERVGRVGVVDDDGEARARRSARRAPAAAPPTATPAAMSSGARRRAPTRWPRRAAMFSTCGAPTSGLANGRRLAAETERPRGCLRACSRPRRAGRRRRLAPDAHARRPDPRRRAARPPRRRRSRPPRRSRLARRGQQLEEEPRLGGVVRLHVAVEIEMVARQVA